MSEFSLTNGLRLVSLNIERDKHLDIILSFLKEFIPDVVCLQELLKPDFEMFKKNLGMKGLFSPMTKMPIIRGDKEVLIIQGVGLLTKLPIEHINQIYYSGYPGSLSKFNRSDMTTANWIFLYATVVKNNQRYTLGTTHFIWSSDGKSTEFQRKGLKSLLDSLEGMPEIVFCGDFNTSRGSEIWNEVARCYKDNIPLKYQTSLDPKIHRYGNLQKIVDGLFSTPDYHIQNVRLVNGLSDHCAIIAEVYHL